jgi:hypothetical protein
MNDVLRSFLHRFMLVFFDDILIYSSSWAEHSGVDLQGMPAMPWHTLRFCRLLEYIYVRKTCVYSIGGGRRRRLASPRKLAKQPSAHDTLIAASAVTHRVSGVSIHDTDRMKGLFLKLTQTASHTRTIVSSRLHTRRCN